MHITREGDRVVLWGARDVREKYRGGGGDGGGGSGGAGGDGSGGKEVMGGGVPGRAKCPTCGDKCCGLARQLVERVAGVEMGSSKVRFCGGFWI